MAIFNPQIQTEGAPNWMGSSRPISAYEGDKSFGTMLQGAGNLIKATVEGADTIVKSFIDDGLRKDLEQQRDIQTGALEGAVGIPLANRVSPYLTTPEADAKARASLTGGTAEDIPEGLNGLDSAVTSANNGAKNKPRLSSYYNGQLDMIAKDYRSRYPGYADYIDQRVSSITGGNPANKRLEELTSMLAQSQTGTQASTTKAMTIMKENIGYPGAPQLAAEIAAGKHADPQLKALEFIAPWKNIERQRADSLAEINLYNGNEGVRQKMAGQGAVAVAKNIADTNWSQVSERLKDRNDRNSADKLQTIADDVLNKRRVITDQEGQDYTIAAQTVHDSMKTQIEKALNARGRNNEPSFRMQTTNEVYNAAITDALAPYKRLVDAFGNKEYGLGFEQMRSIPNYTSNASQYLLSKSPNKEYYQMLPAIKSLGGDTAVGAVISGDPSIVNKLASEVEQYRKHHSAALVSKPEADAVKIIQELKEANIGKDPNNKAERAMFQYFSEGMANKITDTRIDPTTRTILTRNMFKGDMAAEFEKDGFDSKGNVIPGKFTVINNMTNQKVAASIWELAGKDSQSPLWSQYKNWVARQQGNLSSDAFKSISDLQANPHIKFSYNTTSNQFDIKFLPSFYTQHPLQKTSPEAALKLEQNYRSALSFVNSAMYPGVNVARQEGSSPSEAILRQVSSLGINLKGMGLPSELYRSLIGPEPKKEEEKKTDNAPIYTPSKEAVQSREAVTGFVKKLFTGQGLPAKADDPVQPQDMTRDTINNFAPEENDATLNSVQSFVKNPDRGRSVKTPKTKNVSSEEFLAMTVDEIPEGMSARDFLKQLQSKK